MLCHMYWDQEGFLCRHLVGGQHTVLEMAYLHVENFETACV